MVKEKRQETQILKMEFLENGALVAEGMAKDIGAIKFMEEQEPRIREQISSRIKVPAGKITDLGRGTAMERLGL